MTNESTKVAMMDAKKPTVVLCNEPPKSSNTSLILSEARGGEPPIHIAAAAGDANRIKILVKAQVNVNILFNGLTPIYKAIQAGSVEAVKVLVEAGAELNHHNYKHETPVYVAATLGHAEIIDVLEKAGAHIDLPDANGLTPSDIARQRNHSSALTALLAIKADRSGSIVSEITKQDKTSGNEAPTEQLGAQFGAKKQRTN